MMTDLQLYALTGVVQTVVALAFAAGVFTKPDEDRQYYLPVVVVPLVSGLSFLLMSQGILLVEQPGDQPPAVVGRIIGYMIVWPLMAGFIGYVGGLSRRKIATLSTVMFMVPLGIGLRWAPSPGLAKIAPLLLIGGVIGIAYLLLGPYNQSSLDVTGERKLLYAKLRNLLLLVWFIVLVGAMSVDSALGFMDRFTSVFFANYTDMLAAISFGLLVLRADDAVSQLSDGESETSGEPREQSEAPVADAAD